VKAISTTDIIQGLANLGLRGDRVVVHSSLRSFGQVAEGPEGVIRALLSEFSTVLMPAFPGAANALAPEAQRPRQNGCDYAVHFDPIQPPPPFRIETAPIHPKMGVLCHVFARWPGVLRSNHPWHSWLARGKDAPGILEPHPWDTTNPPLERLSDAGGWVVLVGVGLAACTAVHVAEERAGRRPFVRWAVHPDGSLRPVRVSGCAKGFGRLTEVCRPLFREVNVGPARITAIPMKGLINACAEAILRNPNATKCSDTCLRCRDAALGGPLFPPLGASR
jgi:aminoglycoside N3'-acetyltransferase